MGGVHIKTCTPLLRENVCRTHLSQSYSVYVTNPNRLSNRVAARRRQTLCGRHTLRVDVHKFVHAYDTRFRYMSFSCQPRADLVATAIFDFQRHLCAAAVVICAVTDFAVKRAGGAGDLVVRSFVQL